MPRDFTVAVRVTANARGLAASMRASRDDVDRLSRAIGRSAEPAGRAATATTRLERATRGAGRAFAAAHGHHVRYLSGLASVYTLQRAARSLSRITDAYTRFTNAVRLSTSSVAEAHAVQRDLVAVAQRTRAPLDATVQLYQRLAPAADAIGASQGDLLAVVQSVGRIGRIKRRLRWLREYRSGRCRVRNRYES